MSVLACGRVDCQNCMCDRLLFGGEMYICDSCYDELCEYKESWEALPDRPPLTESLVEQLIQNFMESSPGSHRVKPLLDRQSVDEVFNRFTGNSIPQNASK